MHLQFLAYNLWRATQALRQGKLWAAQRYLEDYRREVKHT